MDKQFYKEMLSDSSTEISKLKSKLKEIEDMVKNIPNNMELGKTIRSYFFEIDERDISKNRR